MSDIINKLSTKAEKFVAENKFDEAATVYQKICKIDSKNPSAWMALGSITANLKRFKDAESAFRQAYKLQSSNSLAAEYLAQALDLQGKNDEAVNILEDAYNKTSNVNLTLKIGISHALRNDFVKSISWIKKYIDRNDNDAYAHHCMASAYESLNDADNASQHYIRSIELDSTSHQVLCNYGAFLQKKGDFNGALEAYLKSTTINDQYPLAQYNLGSVYYALGKYLEATTHYTKAIQIEPTYTEAYVGLGRSYRSSGEAIEAIKCYDRAISLDSKCIEAYSNKGRALLTHGHNDEAMASYKTALSLDPGNIEIECAIASLHERKGEYDTAMSIITRLLEQAPDNNFVSLTYGTISRKFDERDKAISVMKNALLNPTLSPTDQSDIYYVIGKLYDDLKDYDNAFDNFKSANDLLPYEFNSDALKRSVDHLKSAFSAENLNSYARNSNPSDKPIFIVGMPRSGTTLIEQIISSHPDVYGAGELPHISHLARGLPARLNTEINFPDNLKFITPEISEQMANEYVKLATANNPGCNRVTDKMPHNFRLLGLIELLFPNAKIIHCTRSPIDTCLSIYVNSFVTTHPYATDLKQAGIYYTDYYQEIMAHWNNVSSLSIKEVNYELLIDNQEELSREIIDFCGLEWNDNCLNFHKSKRDVATISYDQVRQPIYKKSKERWRNYEKHIQPLLDHFDIQPK